MAEVVAKLGVKRESGYLYFLRGSDVWKTPMKRAGGRRFYRPQDISVLRGVRTLLHDEGYTIKGVQKLHKEQGVKRLLAAGNGAAHDKVADLDDSDHLNTAAISTEGRQTLTAALADLQSAKAHLDGLLHRR